MSDIVTSFHCLRNLTPIFFSTFFFMDLKQQVNHAQGQIIIAISGLGHLGTDVGDGDTMMSNQNPIDRGQPKTRCQI